MNGVKVCPCNDLDIFENVNCRNQSIVSWCALVLSCIIKFMNYSFSIASFTTSLKNSVLLFTWKFLVYEVFLTSSRWKYLKKWGYSSIGCHIIATNCDIIGIRVPKCAFFMLFPLFWMGEMKLLRTYQRYCSQSGTFNIADSYMTVAVECIFSEIKISTMEAQRNSNMERTSSIKT